MFIDWKNVNRVLVVRLRSIGDTVLATPALIALKRFLPAAQIDVLLEDWVAPVLENFQTVDNVLAFQKNNLKSRLKMARQIRRNRYDVVFNLHGGTTGTFFVCASGARHRIGFENYQYKFFYNHRLRSASDFWQKEFTHSAEQQLALLGFVGVPVEDKPKSQLVVSEKNAEQMDLFVRVHGIDNEKIALIHPAAAFEAKQWSTENFAKVIDYLAARSIFSVAVAAPAEKYIIEKLSKETSTAFHGFIDLTLPEITALAARAEIFIGNDSGIAHIAAAVNTPTIVVFGASNINHWRPWTDAPNEVVYAKKTCNHQFRIRKGSENPKCIFCVEPQDVFIAIEQVLPKNLPVS
jgi:predicted lipopolysaccharide heptosyltransferase III